MKGEGNEEEIRHYKKERKRVERMGISGRHLSDIHKYLWFPLNRQPASWPWRENQVVYEMNIQLYLCVVCDNEIWWETLYKKEEKKKKKVEREREKTMTTFSTKKRGVGVPNSVGRCLRDDRWYSGRRRAFSLFGQHGNCIEGRDEKKERDTTGVFLSLPSHKKKMKWNNKLENNQLLKRLATLDHGNALARVPGYLLSLSLKEVCHTLHWWLGFFFWLEQQKVKKKIRRGCCKEPWLIPCFLSLFLYWSRISTCPAHEGRLRDRPLRTETIFSLFLSFFLIVWPQFQ